MRLLLSGAIEVLREELAVYLDGGNQRHVILMTERRSRITVFSENAWDGCGMLRT
jgi:hypothetical protein